MDDVFRQPVDLLARVAAEFPAIVFSVKRKKKSQKSLQNMEKQTVFQ